MSGRSRFYFLRTNRFFESTPLTGYAFISTSKTLFETIVWYAVIALFSVAAVVSMYQTANYYITSPTRTYVRTASRTDNMSMGNISLSLKASLLDFSQVNPTTISYLEPVTEGMDTFVQYLACNMRLAPYDTWKSWMMQHTLTELAAAMVQPFNGTSAQEKDSYADRRDDLYDYLHEHWEEPLPVKGKRKGMLREAQRLMNKALEGNNDVFRLLALLEAMRDDTDPRAKFFQLEPVQYIFELLETSSDYWKHRKITEKTQTLVDHVYDLFTQAVQEGGAMYKDRPSEILTKLSLTGSQLLDTITDYMDDVIFVTTEGEVRMTNWTYGAEEVSFAGGKTLQFTKGIDAWHKFDLNVEPLGGIQQIDIGIAFKAHTWMMGLLQGW